MAGDDLFKRYLEIGASVLGMSRERAESIVRDLVASGEVAKGQATKAADWLVERGRAGSEEFTELIRREIRQQITALGLATQADIAGLQAQIDELKAAAPPPVPAGTETRKAAAAAARKAAGTTARKAAPAERPAATTKAAGVTRSAPRKRSGADAPPAGGSDPSKG
jgi:polyhydroxyalkanoate synthesis regulator phasin